MGAGLLFFTSPLTAVKKGLYPFFAFPKAHAFCFGDVHQHNVPAGGAGCLMGGLGFAGSGMT
jgi:hypothetical protein